jgi:DNA polymerase-1
MSDRAWIEKCDYSLVLNKLDWEKWVIGAGEKVCLDLETSGLNHRVDYIVGISLSKKEGEAVYIPIAHPDNNFEDIPWFYKKLEEFFLNRVLLAYNAKFDINFLEYANVTIPKYEDVMISVYLQNSNEKQKGLKASSKRLLGLEMIEIEELFEPPDEYDKKGNLKKKKKVKKDAIDFTIISPEESREYACSDADITLRLYNFLAPVRVAQQKVYTIESKALPVIREMESNGVMLDSDFLARLPEKTRVKAELLANNIREKLGVPDLDILSNKQLGAALDAKGVPLPRSEKTQNFQIGKKQLSEIAHKYPIAQDLIEYRQYMKAVNTYMIALYKGSLNHRCFFRMNQCAAPSGRFSSGKDVEMTARRNSNDGYMPVNVQAINSNAGSMWHPVLQIKKRYKKDTKALLYKYEEQVLDLEKFEK